MSTNSDSTNPRSGNCSSTCGTQDHATFGECLRAKNLRLSHDGKLDHVDAQRKWDKELDSYRSAVRQGMEPESTREKDIKAAVRWSENHGVAYSAETKHSVDLNAALTKVA